MDKKYDLSGKMKDIFGYNEEAHLAVVMAYLVDGKSMREIQSEILDLPAPLLGGGYVAMNILHYYGISGAEKGILRKKSIGEIQQAGNEKLRDILRKIKEFQVYEKEVKEQIKRRDFEFRDKKTQISTITKVRINQNVLRQVVLGNYNNECSLCEIKEKELLVCSHIIPWALNEKNRLNPQNNISFCVLHDKLFDKGYFSLDDNFNLILGNKIDSYINLLLKDLKFKKPRRDGPLPEFLIFHREKILRRS